MKSYRTWSRKQLALAGCMIVLLGTVAIVPWRVVAQEGKPAAENETKQPAAEYKSPAKTPEQLLVGAWRAGNSGGKLTIRSDGTYEETEPWLTVVPNNWWLKRISGDWKISGQDLAITPNFGKNFVDDRGEYLALQHSKIVRLDDSFLRLTRIDKDKPYVFYRRVTDISPLEAIADKLPLDVLRLSQLLKLDSEEALALADWNKQSNVINKKLLELIERLDAARQDKIDTAELFQFSADEAKAYEALAKITAGQFQRAQVLSQEGLLAANELAAVKKMEKFGDEFYKVCGAIGSIFDGGMAGPRGGMMGPRGGMGFEGEFGPRGRGGMMGVPMPMAPGAGGPRGGEFGGPRATQGSPNRQGEEILAPGEEPRKHRVAQTPPESGSTSRSDVKINPRAGEEALTKLNAYLQELEIWLSRGPFQEP